MYDPNSITFAVTYKNVPAMKPLTQQLRFLGRGYKKELIDQLILKVASQVEQNPRIVQAICAGRFEIKIL